MTATAETYSFAGFLLDVPDRLLTRGGLPVAVTPKGFDLLTCFVRNPARLIEKSELLAEVWPGVTVEEVTLARTVSDLRKAMGEGVGALKLIETVPKFGYRFVPEVMRGEPAEPDPVPSLTPAVPAATPTAGNDSRLAGNVARRVGAGVALATLAGLVLFTLVYFRTRAAIPSDIHSLAVLPFVVLGPEIKGPGSPGTDTLALGTADTVISQLSRAGNLDVRSVTAVQQYLAAGRDPLRAARELGVDAVLDGSIHRTGAGWKVNLRLIGSRDGRTVWSVSLDEPSPDVAALENGIAERVWIALSPRFRRSSDEVSTRPFTQNEEAWRNYEEGRFLFSRRSRESMEKAQERFGRAIELDPRFAEAHAALAEVFMVDGYGARPQSEVIAAAREHANLAIGLNPALAAPHRVLAVAAENYDYDRVAAENEYRKALDIAPNDATTHHFFGEFLGLVGRFDEAEREFRIGDRLDPTSLVLQCDWAKNAAYSRDFPLAI